MSETRENRVAYFDGDLTFARTLSTLLTEAGVHVSNLNPNLANVENEYAAVITDVHADHAEMDFAGLNRAREVSQKGVPVFIYSNNLFSGEVVNNWRNRFNLENSVYFISRSQVSPELFAQTVFNHLNGLSD